jgi:hypothetical protein
MVSVAGARLGLAEPRELSQKKPSEAVLTENGGRQSPLV